MFVFIVYVLLISLHRLTKLHDYCKCLNILLRSPQSRKERNVKSNIHKMLKHICVGYCNLYFEGTQTLVQTLTLRTRMKKQGKAVTYLSVRHNITNASQTKKLLSYLCDKIFKKRNVRSKRTYHCYCK